MVVRITVPLRSQGVETVSWATCTDGRPATTDDSGRPVAASRSSTRVMVATASAAGRKSGHR